MMGEVALCGRGCCYIRSSLFSCSPWEFMATAAATLMRPVLLASSSSKTPCVVQGSLYHEIRIRRDFFSMEVFFYILTLTAM